MVEESKPVTLKDIPDMAMAQAKATVERLRESLKEQAAEEQSRRVVYDLIKNMKVFIATHCGKPGVSPKAIQDWIAKLGSDDFSEREEASRKLREDAGFHARPALKALPKSSDLEVKRRAKDILQLFDHQADDIRRDLIPLGWKDRPGNKDVVQVLIRVLAITEDDAPLRHVVIKTLQDMGPDAKAAIPDLVAILKGDNSPVAVSAVWALGHISTGEKEVVSALGDALKHPRSGVRWGSAAALMRMGPAAKEALPALTAALNDKDLSVVSEAKMAINAIEKPIAEKSKNPPGKSPNLPTQQTKKVQR